MSQKQKIMFFIKDKSLAQEIRVTIGILEKVFPPLGINRQPEMRICDNFEESIKMLKKDRRIEVVFWDENLLPGKGRAHLYLSLTKVKKLLGQLSIPVYYLTLGKFHAEEVKNSDIFIGNIWRIFNSHTIAIDVIAKLFSR